MNIEINKARLVTNAMFHRRAEAAEAIKTAAVADLPEAIAKFLEANQNYINALEEQTRLIQE